MIMQDNNDLDLAQFLENMFHIGLTPVVITEPDDVPPVEETFSFFKDDDGVWNLVNKGKVLGWVNRINIAGAEHKWRAMSAISYNMEWFYSLDAARCWLFEQSH